VFWPSEGGWVVGDHGVQLVAYTVVVALEFTLVLLLFVRDERLVTVQGVTASVVHKGHTILY
jgi:hypothetical protein